jgi:hypothetical protein
VQNDEDEEPVLYQPAVVKLCLPHAAPAQVGHAVCLKTYTQNIQLLYLYWILSISKFHQFNTSVIERVFILIKFNSAVIVILFNTNRNFYLNSHVLFIVLVCFYGIHCRTWCMCVVNVWVNQCVEVDERMTLVMTDRAHQNCVAVTLVLPR